MRGRFSISPRFFFSLALSLSLPTPFGSHLFLSSLSFLSVLSSSSSSSSDRRPHRKPPQGARRQAPGAPQCVGFLFCFASLLVDPKNSPPLLTSLSSLPSHSFFLKLEKKTKTKTRPPQALPPPKPPRRRLPNLEAGLGPADRRARPPRQQADDGPGPLAFHVLAPPGAVVQRDQVAGPALRGEYDSGPRGSLGGAVCGLEQGLEDRGAGGI